MTDRAPRRTADLRGAARLATDATAGLTDLVEAMHERIARIPGLGAKSLDGRTGGISGLVYKTIRGVTRVVGGSIEALLGLLAPALDPAQTTGDPSHEREAIVAALNGVLGDYMAASANPLATSMALCRDGRALVLETAALAERLPDAGGRLLVLAHGLCMNDLQWTREGHDHGAAPGARPWSRAGLPALQRRLHVSINGHALAQPLELLLGHRRARWSASCCSATASAACWRAAPCTTAHRQATAGPRSSPTSCFSAHRITVHRWRKPVDWIDIVLGATPYAAPFARLGKVRSAGITDLRHGNLVDEDWVGRDRFARSADRRQHLPLPDTVRCYAAAASIGEQSGDLKDRLLGDGLVPLDSALGRHRNAARTLVFADDRQWIGYGMNHLGLLNRPEVYAQLRQWLA